MSDDRDEETEAFVAALFAPKPSQAALLQALHPPDEPDPDDTPDPDPAA